MDIQKRFGQGNKPMQERELHIYTREAANEDIPHLARLMVSGIKGANGKEAECHFFTS